MDISLSLPCDLANYPCFSPGLLTLDLLTLGLLTLDLLTLDLLTLIVNRSRYTWQMVNKCLYKN